MLRAAPLALVALAAAACGPPEWVRANAAASSAFLSVHGTGPSDVWAVGDVGTISRFDGKEWKALPAVTSVHLRSVAAVTATDAWAVGDQGTILRWDGKAWTRLATSFTTNLLTVVALAANDVWILPKDTKYLLHWDGAALGQVDATTRSGYSATCLWGNARSGLWLMSSSANHAYLVTTAGLAELPLNISGDFDCDAISGQAPDDVWFLSDEALLHWDGKLFRPVAPPAKGDLLAATFYMRAIFAVARDEAWVVGTGGGIYRILGQTWTQSVAPAYSAPNLNVAWGARTDDLWAAGAAGAMYRHSTPTVAP